MLERVVGGIGAMGVLSSAELYDPDTNTFTAAGSLAEARRYHSATRLSDGRVLVVGGHDVDGNLLASAEVYDPKTDRFAIVGSMEAPRENHAAAPLPNGFVLVSGGYGLSGAPQASAEIFVLQPPGRKCAVSTECRSYYCVDGVCCDKACTPDDSCNACSRARGAKDDGVCTAVLACSPFVCDTTSTDKPACTTVCKDQHGCAEGFGCAPPPGAQPDATEGMCIPIPSRTSSVDDSDCSLSPPVAGASPRAPLSPGILLFAALAALGRRLRQRLLYFRPRAGHGAADEQPR